jgi:hypothetical protein
MRRFGLAFGRRMAVERSLFFLDIFGERRARGVGIWWRGGVRERGRWGGEEEFGRGGERGEGWRVD